MTLPSLAEPPPEAISPCDAAGAGVLVCENTAVVEFCIATYPSSRVQVALEP